MRRILEFGWRRQLRSAVSFQAIKLATPINPRFAAIRTVPGDKLVSEMFWRAEGRILIFDLRRL